MNRIANQRREEIQQLAEEYIAESIPYIKDNHLKTLKIANQLLSFADITHNPDNPEEVRKHKYKMAVMSELSCQLSSLGIDPKDILSLADKKEYRALVTMGIIPSHTQSTFIQAIINTDNINIGADVLSIVGRHLDEMLDITPDESL